MAPDDEDDGDLYDDEFDFVDEDDDDDDDSDLDDEADDDEADSDADDDSDLDSDVDRAAEPADSELDDSKLDDAPAPRPVAPKRPARAEQAKVNTPADRDVDRDFDRDRDADRDVDGDRDGDRNEDLAGEDEPSDEFATPPPAANFRVHIYEYQQFKRTIDRPFTAEDAEAFASEYNRTSKSYGRFAIAGKDDAKPRKALD